MIFHQFTDRQKPQRGGLALSASLSVLLLVAALVHWTTDAAADAIAPTQTAAFNFEAVVEKAKQLAAAPFADSRNTAPEFLRRLDYDQWRDLRFKPDHALWRSASLPFNIQFFHPGFLYDRPVIVHNVEGDAAVRLDYDKNFFDFGKNTIPEPIPADMGFAGFRVHTLMNSPVYYDELIAFLGASYFRAVAKGQSYGLSARGLGVDTAEPKGEEFPFFKEFWIVKPSETDKKITIYALLDSPSVAGAYAFKARAGEETLIDVEAVLFLRKSVDKLCIAPLTSMFLFGENSSPKSFDDYRPEVHDSDGLLIAQASGEWVWRPLQNPRNLLLNSFEANDPKGFGLLQRDRDVNNHQDFEALYHLRPSLWISPVGAWGQGRVELVQIPTDQEIHDNIVVYWTPKEFPQPGAPLRFEYLMRWHSKNAALPPLAAAVATRTGAGAAKGSRLFVVDFEGKTLNDIPADGRVGVDLSVGKGATLIDKQVYKNPATNGWRLAFRFQPEAESKLQKVLSDPPQPVELRAYLQRGADILTETWTYTYIP